MDFHALQQKLFEMDPSDPREDLAKLQAHAQNGGASNVPPTKDYVNESVDVPQGSMPLGLDSVADFAALAGIRLDEKQKHGDYARGKDPMPKAEPGRTKHPLKDKLVGEDENTEQNPELNGLIEKFVGKGMPEKAARMFAQIAYMHFNESRDEMPWAGPDQGPRDEMPWAGPDQFKKSPYEQLPRNANESTSESIKDRLYAALKDYK